MRPIICGGRTYATYRIHMHENGVTNKTCPICIADEIRVPKQLAHLRAILDAFLTLPGIEELAHGAARGADSEAQYWAIEHSVPHRSFPAQWMQYGRSAGYERNAQMLRQFDPTHIIAFPGGAGTANMVNIALAANITIIEIRDPE